MNGTKEAKLQKDQKSERSLLDGLLYYISIIYRYRKIVLIITCCSMVLSLVFCGLSLLLPPEKSPLPNVYAAQANILIQPNSQADLAQSILVGLGYDQAASSQIGIDNAELVMEVLHSRKLLDKIIDEFDMAARYRITANVRGKTREAVLKRATFAYSRLTGSLKISYEDIDPEFSQRVVNRMVSLLDEWFRQNMGQAKAKQEEMLAEKLEEVKADIARLQEKLKGLQKKYGVLSVQDLGTSQATSLANLRAQLILKEIEIKNYSSFSKVDDPQLAQLRDERQTLLDLINQTQSGMSEASYASSGEISLPDVAQNFSQLTVELEVQQRIFNTLSPLYEAAKLTPESAPVFQILELAEIPDIKARPQRSNIVIVSTMLGLAGSIVFSLLSNLVQKIRNDPEKRKYFG